MGHCKHKLLNNLEIGNVQVFDDKFISTYSQCHSGGEWFPAPRSRFRYLREAGELRNWKTKMQKIRETH
jgi:hypothetical protein